MKKVFLGLALLITSLSTPTVAAAQNAQWYYPMTDYDDRIVVKNFHTLIDKAFYQGKEALFPGLRLYGYHAGVDLDAFANEQDQPVPVYAITNGTIRYIGTNVQGYGGVIIQSLDSTSDTALYGHVKASDTGLKVGDKITVGQQLTILGKPFSSETGGERKHLHFAIHKGTDLYFKGHEDTQVLLGNKWENPTMFLSDRHALAPNTLKVSPSSSPIQSVAPSSSSQTNIKQNQSIFAIIISWFEKFGQLFR